jgi:hypothetical protein
MMVVLPKAVSEREGPVDHLGGVYYAGTKR